MKQIKVQTCTHTLIALTLLASIFSGCKKKEDWKDNIEGTWVVTKKVIGGGVFSENTIYPIRLGDTFILNEDGSAICFGNFAPSQRYGAYGGGAKTLENSIDSREWRYEKYSEEIKIRTYATQTIATSPYGIGRRDTTTVSRAYEVRFLIKNVTNTTLKIHRYSADEREEFKNKRSFVVLKRE